MSNDFQIGDRVELHGHWEFPDGATGVVAEPHPEIVALCEPGEWQGPRRVSPGRAGPIITYYVSFDVPQDDGSGDGPYRGAEIDASSLRRLPAG